MGSVERMSVAVIGAGPAGLTVAERLASAGLAVTVFDRMPSVARKFLMAGRGGLNLTHGEALDVFITRYGADADPRLVDAVRRFPPSAAIAWAEGLGQETFVGSSGRVFPKSMKASPLLRAWLGRLGQLGVVFRLRTKWVGFGDDGSLRIEAYGAARDERFDAVVLALGGASWPRLGSDGEWVSILEAHGIEVRRLQPANVGFRVGWSEHLKSKCSGKPLKRIAVSFAGETRKVRGEALIAVYGIEGGVIYAVGEAIRERLTQGSPVALQVDLRPDIAQGDLTEKLTSASSKQSMSNTLRKQAGLDATAAALLYESVRLQGPLPRTADQLAARIKQVMISVDGFAGLERAISTAGGVAFTEIDDQFMLRRLPGLFVAGEMLDWTAPTGGYLLQGCLATGVAAAEGVSRWLARCA